MNFLKLFFPLILCFTTTVAFAAEKPKEYGDWQLSCSEVQATTGDKMHNICQLSQTLSTSQKDEATNETKTVQVASYSFVRKDDKLYFIASVPADVLLKPGAAVLVVDKKSVEESKKEENAEKQQKIREEALKNAHTFPGHFDVCMNGSCTASIELTSRDIKHITEHNKVVSVAFFTAKQQQVGLLVSVKGLNDGLKHLK